jgi:hypothetical protein
MLVNDFIEKWNNIPMELGIIQLIADNSLLCFGRDYENRKTMLFSSEIEPSFDIKSSSFTIKKILVGKKWQTSVILLNSAEEDAFRLFLWDLFENSLNTFSESELIKRFHKRLVIWVKLFENKSGYLSLDSIQGLLGELIVLKEILQKKSGIRDAILGWRGPLGEDQDYIMSNEWIEVKSIRYGKEKLSISSLEQLERVDEGRLLVVELEQSSEIDPLAINLFDYVEEIKKLIGDDLDLQLELERRLLSVGYKDEIEYKKYRFTLKRIRDYLVKNDFPRLLRSNIRSEIVNLNYTLSLPTIEGWRGLVNNEY